jgi:hypothetical protein
VEAATKEKNGMDSSRAPRTGLRLMLVIVAGVALVALYANIQKSRRDKIEQVTITPVSTVTPVPSSPAPN